MKKVKVLRDVKRMPLISEVQRGCHRHIKVIKRI